ncbi:copper homeostasis protein CutC [Brevibacillus laterosporus]|uniref:copper homeostasis protein CutC n=1 Tax=Brevibacillus laterosporus TaxID=1465 RepID=UPI000EB28EEE|nr:copper homeostasis protein CutC [Brevibacillus laterosporus]AYK05540.1 copper homeostasis protein CutC [Brevibacillus laterosporus]
MILEVIATTLDDAKRAEAGGADRLELITGIREGGLTPSYGLIKNVVDQVKIPVRVMVRPHSQSFVYTTNDIDVMLKDIQIIRELGAAGVVLGALTPDHHIDFRALETLLTETGHMHVTFHRAFDEVEDQVAALEQLLHYKQIDRILTSGGKSSALQAVDQMKTLVERTASTHVTILAGAGLTIETVSDFVKETGVREVHFGTGVRQDGQALKPVDTQLVALVKNKRNG